MYECIWDAGNIRINYWNAWEIVFLLQGLTENIWPCRVDQINADPKGTWDRMGRKNFIRKLYMNQIVKRWLDQGRQEVWRLEEDLDKEAVSLRFC